MIMGYILYRTISLIFYVIETATFVYCVLSWIMPQSRVYEMLSFLLEPFVRPFRPLGRWIMTKTGLPIDFSFMIFMFALYAAERLIIRILIRFL